LEPTHQHHAVFLIEFGYTHDWPKQVIPTRDHLCKAFFVVHTRLEGTLAQVRTIVLFEHAHNIAATTASIPTHKLFLFNAFNAPRNFHILFCLR
jgi:hypothetical protein